MHIGVPSPPPSEGTYGFFINLSRTHFFLENVLLLLLKEHPSTSETHRGRISFL